jgi:hypothetical protein
MSDLSAFIDASNTYCLNEKSTHSHKNLFAADTRFTLQSDVDAQVRMHAHNETKSTPIQPFLPLLLLLLPAAAAVAVAVECRPFQLTHKQSYISALFC